MIDDFLLNLEKEIKDINDKIDNLNLDTEIEILTTTDIMEILQINRNTALKLFATPGFPKILGINGNKVEKKAFLTWLRNQNELNNS